MPAIKKNEVMGPTNKYIALRIWSKHTDTKPNEFFKELKLLFIGITNGDKLEKLFDKYPLGKEVLEALP